MTLQGAIKQLHELRCNEDMPIFFKPVIAEVINVLLMDAKEVRHGRLIDKGDFWVNCSICDCEVLKNEHDPILRYTENYLYCPHCGAKMEGEEE